MRRPHVYERSAPRSPRNPYHEPSADATATARELAVSLVSLLSKAEAAGLTGLAGLIQRAVDEAESVLGRDIIMGAPKAS